MRRLMLTVLALVCCTGTATAQMDHPSKVDLTFNKWYDYEEMTKAEVMLKLVRSGKYWHQTEQGFEEFQFVTQNKQIQERSNGFKEAMQREHVKYQHHFVPRPSSKSSSCSDNV